MDDSYDIPVEDVPVTLFDGVVRSVRSTDSRLWVAVADLAMTVGAVERTQLRRVQAHPLLQRHIRRFRVQTPGGMQRQLFLELHSVGLWLMTIKLNQAPEEIKTRLLWLQQHLEATVQQAFAAATGLPARSSDIEDIDDIGAIDTILAGVREQQQSLRSDHTHLHADVRDLAARLRTLEQQRPQTRAEQPILSKAERGQIYHLVAAWATQLQARNEGMSVGAARAACWVALKRRYHVAEYHHIPADRYNDAVAFIQAAVAELGGDLPAQTTLDWGSTDAK